jgi:hypothetical protein
VTSKASGGPTVTPIGVFVLDDHEIVRRGVRGVLEAEPDIRWSARRARHAHLVRVREDFGP